VDLLVFVHKVCLYSLPYLLLLIMPAELLMVRVQMSTRPYSGWPWTVQWLRR